jgi:hypothetical protein
MRVLFDQGTPVPLRDFLNPDTVMTVYEMGWSRTRNGDLLRLAAQQMFEVFLTNDQILKHQENLTASHIAIAVLPTTSWPVIQKRTAKIAAVLESIAPGDFIEIDFLWPSNRHWEFRSASHCVQRGQIDDAGGGNLKDRDCVLPFV